MLPSLSINQNNASHAQTQDAYKWNVVTVNTLINKVLSSGLPNLNNPPPDWKDSINSYIQVKSYAQIWKNDVLSRLMTIPERVMGYYNVINTLLNDVQNQATVLVNQQTTQLALKILALDLDDLSRQQLNPVALLIAGTINSIQTFQSRLPDMALQLQAMTQKSISAAKTAGAADGAVLNAFADNYALFASQAEALIPSLEAVCMEWQALETNIDLAIVDSAKAAKDMKIPNFNAVSADIDDAIMEWSLAYTQASVLNLD